MTEAMAALTREARVEASRVEAPAALVARVEPAEVEPAAATIAAQATAQQPALDIEGLVDTLSIRRPEPPALDPDTLDWLPGGDRRCSRRGRKRFCDGPLRAPRAHGAGAELAERLGLGDRAAFFAMTSPGQPPEPWVAAVAGRAEPTLEWPVPNGYLGRRFGHTRREELAHRLHRGIDIPAAGGARVVAANDALVVYADNEMHGYGNIAVLLHADGTATLYAHCQALYVFAGQQVARGEAIGEVGKTGLAGANHLHFEYRRRGIARNPARRLVGRPDHDTESRLQLEQLRRSNEARARLAEARERARRRMEKRGAQAANGAHVRSPGADPVADEGRDQATVEVDP